MASLAHALAADAWTAFADDPLPGWCSRRATAFDVAGAALSAEPASHEVSVCSVPFDSTASTRIGARDGPGAIRRASLAYSSQSSSRGHVLLQNLRTGRVQTMQSPDIVDFGDLHVYPSNPSRQVEATAAEVFQIASHAERVVVLGGEHLITYPVFAAVMAARRETGRRTGFLQIDHHFDFGDRSSLHGAYYHGSNARRIAELPGMSLKTMGFVGMGDLTSASQLTYLLDSGAVIRPMRDVTRRGFDTCLHEALTELANHCDEVYVSIDIDVCDSSTACGTGNVTIGGISATDLLTIPSILHDYPIAGLDIVEVNPTLDPSGTTAHLAARLLFEWLFLREVADETYAQAPQSVAVTGSL